jgi:hypothetical protein
LDIRDKLSSIESDMVFLEENSTDPGASSVPENTRITIDDILKLLDELDLKIVNLQAEASK